MSTVRRSQSLAVMSKYSICRHTSRFAFVAVRIDCTMEKLIAYINAPYPLTAPRRDLHDARLLQDLYGGRASETTAIIQYCFQSYVLRPTRPELADLLITIAKVEMRHHELLGQAIFGCGKPPLVASNCCFWSASAVDWSEDAVNILERDIADETRAAQAYERTAKLLHSPSLAALLVRVAEDERLHVALLTDALSRLAAK